jgi:hypothetical protein
MVSSNEPDYLERLYGKARGWDLQSQFVVGISCPHLALLEKHRARDLYDFPHHPGSE